MLPMVVKCSDQNLTQNQPLKSPARPLCAPARPRLRRVLTRAGSPVGHVPGSGVRWPGAGRGSHRPDGPETRARAEALGICPGVTGPMGVRRPGGHPQGGGFGRMARVSAEKALEGWGHVSQAGRLGSRSCQARSATGNAAPRPGACSAPSCASCPGSPSTTCPRLLSPPESQPPGRASPGGASTGRIFAGQGGCPAAKPPPSLALREHTALVSPLPQAPHLGPQ